MSQSVLTEKSKKSISVPTIGDKDFLPHYASEEAAGADLKARLEEAITIAPGERALVPTGIRIALPKGYEAQIRPRSGLAYKHGITVLNTPGTIDSDYRGELAVILINHGNTEVSIKPGMRIAQMLITEVTQATFIPVEDLSATERGAGGFGHTGQ